MARIADIFGLVYAAGSLAAHYDVLPWPRDELKSAVASIYQKHRQAISNEAFSGDALHHVRTTILNRQREFIDIRKKQPPMRRKFVVLLGC